MAAVSYEPLQNTITVNCLGKTGSCLFHGLSNVNELTPGQQLEYKGNIRGEIESADFEAWQVYDRDLLQTSTLTPTPAFTPTPVITPTQIPTIAAPTPSPPDDSAEDPDLREQEGGDDGDGGKGG